jgi:excisionase family DNA binding protein
MSGPLLTARRVAEQLGVSPETVLRWTRRGDLPAVRLPGGAIRYREDDLDEWLAGRATPGRGVSTTPQDAAHTQGYCRTSATALSSVASTTPEDEE